MNLAAVPFMEPVIIAAVARNGVIGKGGTLPWRIPEDLARFREITSAPGTCVIMGRKTWESLPLRRGQRLPGRALLVLSRNPEAVSASAVSESAVPAGVQTPRFFRSLDAALEHARTWRRRVYIAGGESVYREALALAGVMLITRVDASPEGDRFFPLDLDSAASSGWFPQSKEPRRGYCFTVWKKLNALPCKAEGIYKN
jgi:dihydrofolate reductase